MFAIKKKKKNCDALKNWSFLILRIRSRAARDKSVENQYHLGGLCVKISKYHVQIFVFDNQVHMYSLYFKEIRLVFFMLPEYENDVAVLKLVHGSDSSTCYLFFILAILKKTVTFVVITFGEEITTVPPFS